MKILLCHAVIFVFIFIYYSNEKVNAETSTSPFIYVFTVPKDNKEKSCLKMQGTFSFSVTYAAKSGNDTINNTVNFTFEHMELSYTGSCLYDRNMIEFQFLENWRLEFYFKNNNLTYSLNHIILYYDFNHPLFPNSIEHGSHSESYNDDYINGTLGYSFSCENGILIDLNDVKINLTNLHLEPFFNKPPNFPYSKEMKCSADIPPTPNAPMHIIVPTVIGGVVFLVFIISIIIYFICRKRHGGRCGYEGVPDN